MDTSGEVSSMTRGVDSLGIRNLLQPQGGIVGSVGQFWANRDEPRLLIESLDLGELTETFTHLHALKLRPHLAGAGAGLDEREAIIPALGESLERYCACVFTDDQFIRATAVELGSGALDLDTIPRCSTKEFSHTRCPLVPASKNAPIRWIQALSLLDGRVVYVPVVMVYLYAGFISRDERIWSPISTGCAAHVSLERALINAILEVIERDAISITWLQQLSLPRLEIDSVSSVLAPYWERYQRSSRELEYVFFDATTDLGIPTVYALQIARANPKVNTLVSCCTALDPIEAVVKVIRDMAACRVAFRHPRVTPNNWDDFTEVHHGASYMTLSENSSAFDFLFSSQTKRFLCELPQKNRADDQRTLESLLGTFRRKGLDLYAVDLSTDEALRVGARVVRVIVPGLQPLGFQYRARYLGHPRLYDAPLKMGYPVRTEEKLNQWPQPFS
jgi:ribosomal protein S12 methylthiotransferase accessory factor